MRCAPRPESVTLLPPSITIFGPVSLKIFAVSSSSITTGSGPQSNVMMPPFATAATNAAPVQLAGVPVPTTCVGDEVSSAPAPVGTAQVPEGLPAGGPRSGFVIGSVTGSPPHPARTTTTMSPALVCIPHHRSSSQLFLRPVVRAIDHEDCTPVDCDSCALRQPAGRRLVDDEHDG